VSEGLPGRGLVWGAVTASLLLAWPWLLAWLHDRRPGWLAGAPIQPLSELVPLVQARGPWRPRLLLAWSALALAAGMLPLGRGWMAADLDAGLLWLVVLAVVGLIGLPVTGPAATMAAGGLLTLTLCLAPLVLRTGSLHLGDLAIAQIGGVGNWFVLRDPFLLLGAGVYLWTAATLWPPPAAGSGPRQGGCWFEVSLRAGLPLVLAHLFTVAYLGSWWAFVPLLDGLAWLQSGLKTLAVLAILLWLRRRRSWSDPAHLVWRQPVVALLVCLGAAIWMAATGAAS
jgi:hypothetical protein